MRLMICAIIVSLAFVQPALAYTYVKCGKTVSVEDLTTEGFELEISSETDEYSGAVGGNWQMKLGSEDSKWLKSNRNIVAKKTVNKKSTDIDISIIKANTPSGPVGTQYKLFGLYSEQPRLEKYNVGGFTGYLKVGEYQCASAND